MILETINTPEATINNSSAIIFIIDGGTAIIATGVKGDLVIPFDCNITSVELLANQSGSVVIDIWKNTYANFPSTVANTIVASAKPTISSALKSLDATLIGWSTSILSGDILRFNVDSVISIKRVTIVLNVTKN